MLRHPMCAISLAELRGATPPALSSRSLRSRFPFTIEDIDLDKQTAVLKAKSGADRPGKLTVVRAINANHFIEAVNEGFLKHHRPFTTRIRPPGLYPAVHSRHFGILGQPVFGQYTGACHPG